MKKLMYLMAMCIFVLLAGCATDETGVTDEVISGNDSNTQGSDAKNDGTGSESTTQQDNPLSEGTMPDADTGRTEEWKQADDDKDGIPNGIEGEGDLDGDSLPDYLDTDSDNDGLSDAEEAGSDPKNPVNNDKDEIPDYKDKDSDNDGLADKDEVAAGTNPIKKDTDGDDDDDLAEIVYGSDPTDPNSSIPSNLFYVVLPYEAPEDVSRTLQFSTDFSNVDIAILLDLSGSMEQEMANLKNEIKEKIIKGIPEKIPGLTMATGFVHFMDMVNNQLFQVDQKITVDADKVQNAVNNLPGTAGGTEPHPIVLYQAATGEGFSANYYSPPGPMGMATKLNIPKADCTGAEGDVGGVCFRELALKLFIMITDESFPVFGTRGTSDCTLQSDADGCFDATVKGYTLKEAIEAMNNINAKFIGVDSGFACENYGAAIDPNTGLCAGDNTTNPPTPAKPPIELNAAKEDFQKVAEGTGSLDKNGKAFLYHTANFDGSGMSDQIAEAVKELTTYIEKDITTKPLSDEECDGQSAAKFVKSSKPNKAIPDNGYTSKDETTFYKVQPKTEVFFDVLFHNDFCQNISGQPKLYKARIAVLGEGGLLSSREVQVIVPSVDPE